MTERKGKEIQIRVGNKIEKRRKGMRRGRKGKRIEAKEGEWKGIGRKEVDWGAGRGSWAPSGT
jgi:hypothetical protein